MNRYEVTTEQSPNVHTNVDGSPINSRRVLAENKRTNHASKLLFTDPSEVEITEREVSNSHWSMDEYRDVDHSLNMRESESMIVSTGREDKINTIKQLKTHNTVEQTKVLFEKPKGLQNSDNGSDVTSPRVDTSPQRDHNRKHAKEHKFGNLKHSPVRIVKNSELTMKDMENIPYKKYNLFEHVEKITLTDDEIREVNKPSSGDKKTPSKSDQKAKQKKKNPAVAMGYKEWVSIKEDQYENQNQDSYEIDKRSYEPQDHGMIKSKTEKQGVSIRDLKDNQECITPKRSRMNDNSHIRHGYNEYYTHQNKSNISKE